MYAALRKGTLKMQPASRKRIRSRCLDEELIGILGFKQAFTISTCDCHLLAVLFTANNQVCLWEFEGVKLGLAMLSQIRNRRGMPAMCERASRSLEA